MRRLFELAAGGGGPLAVLGEFRGEVGRTWPLRRRVAALRRRGLLRAGRGPTCWWASCFSSSASCSWQARSSLRRESKPAEACRGPTTSVPSAARSSPSLVTNAEPAAGRLGEPQRGREPIDEPGATQEPLDERHEFGRGFDEPIGPAHHARLAAQVDVLAPTGFAAAACDAVEPQEADAAGDAERLRR